MATKTTESAPRLAADERAVLRRLVTEEAEHATQVLRNKETEATRAVSEGKDMEVPRGAHVKVAQLVAALERARRRTEELSAMGFVLRKSNGYGPDLTNPVDLHVQLSMERRQEALAVVAARFAGLRCDVKAASERAVLGMLGSASAKAITATLEAFRAELRGLVEKEGKKK